MKKSVTFIFSVVLILCFAIGCKQTEEKRKGEVTKPPAEVVTDVPLQNEEGMSSSGEGASNFPTGTVEGTYGVNYSFREEKDEEKLGDFVYFKSSLHYPVFEGEDKDNLNRLVASLAEEFRIYLPEAKEDAKYYYEMSLADEYVASIFPLEEAFYVSCLWETEQYITLFTQWIGNTGGVHPNVSFRAYVADRATGNCESMESMLNNYNLTEAKLVEYAAEQIRKEHGEALYSNDKAEVLESNVVDFIQNNQWYFNDKGLVLFANPYEIAAYAYGIIECEISYEELEQGLKK